LISFLYCSAKLPHQQTLKADLSMRAGFVHEPFIVMISSFSSSVAIYICSLLFALSLDDELAASFSQKKVKT
jgi:hypothetical protein